MDFNYTKEDFLTGTAPFEEIEKSTDAFQKEQAKTRMAEHAKSVGIRNFMTLYKKYLQCKRQLSGGTIIENPSEFVGQELELDVGNWTANDNGVSRIGFGGNEEIACPHPILPVQRLENIDTGLEKIKLAYKKGDAWKSLICDRKQIASPSKIVDLADNGVAVTSENAKFLIKYLSDVENLNYDKIPYKKSISRLGWVGSEGFSPYVDELIFDGESTFKTFFEAVQPKGKFEKWVETVKKVRSRSEVVPKIVLAASFASALVEPFNCLPFFLHLWGGTEAGKTVALLLAASVWANPEMGRYAHTCNSTAVAQELSASFVNSLPLILDELQIIKDRKDFDQMIYQLSEGVGRARGQKTGGLQKVGTWRNCIMTSGEQPITNSNSGGGAVNRVVEINCEDKKLFENPSAFVSAINHNYGFAGRVFIEKLCEGNNLHDAKQIQENYFKEINKTASEKQSLAASLIMTADQLINMWIFKDDQCITFKEIRNFLASKDDVSANKRAYEWIWGWIAQNIGRFNADNADRGTEVWGVVEDQIVYIYRNVFNKSCIDNGFNPTAFLNWLVREDKVKTNKGEKDYRKRIGEMNVRTIAFYIEEDKNEFFHEVTGTEAEPF